MNTLSNHEDDRSLAVIHVNPPKPDESGYEGPKLSLRDIASTLESKHGVRPVFTRGIAAYALCRSEGVIDAWGFNPNSETRPAPVQIQSNGITVIRDNNGGLGSGEEGTKLGLKLEADGISIINGPAVREYDDQLHTAQKSFYGKFALPTFAIPTTDQVRAINEQNDGRPVVFSMARPYASSERLRTDQVPIEEALSRINSLGGEYVWQPIVDNTIPLPSEIHFADARSKEVAERCREWQKDIRVYWFYGNEHDSTTLKSFEWVPVARFFNLDGRGPDGKAKSVHEEASIEKDTLPVEVVEAIKGACGAIRGDTGQSEISGAFDLTYGQLVGDREDHRWRIGKGSFFQPIPPKTAHLKAEFVSATAAQIARVAKRNDN